MSLRDMLPEWQCHKRVHAARIVSVDLMEGCVHLETPDGAYIVHPVADLWLVEHHPRQGGYLVVYEDGYESFSPAEPFEAGYTAVA